VSDGAAGWRAGLAARLGPAPERLRAAGWPVAQTALAAGAAYLIAEQVFGYSRPFYAGVATVISLGVSPGQRPRRAIELTAGVAVGTAVADLLVLGLGTGSLQLVLVIALAMAVGVALGGGTILVNQAAVAAILVVTLTPPDGGVIVLDRFVQALIGGTTGLLVGQVLFPVDPLRRSARMARPLFRELGAVFTATANALGAGDLARAEAALEDARALDGRVRGLLDTVDAAMETARSAPLRRSARDQLADQRTIAEQIDLAVRNARSLARGAVAVLRHNRSAPRGLSEAVAELAYAVEALGEAFEDPEQIGEARRQATAAALRASAVLDDLTAVRLGVVIGHVRATAVDLLRGTGLDLQEALTAVDPDPDP
jgi:uncharacterized membrane protein YgaE (UPF0421/DUF939 family)